LPRTIDIASGEASTPRTRPPAATDGQAGTADFARVISDRRVIAYTCLALLALLPGLAAWLLADRLQGTALGPPLADLGRVLVDIRFGSGLRFWLGVAGATAMGTMLLYPLRKMFGQRFRLFAIGGWFHLHIILGLLGPVLILYHANFGWGGVNANAALVLMLAIAASGIVGHFVYMRVSARFYVQKQQAAFHLSAFRADLESLDGMHVSVAALADRLEAFQAELLKPRQGIVASLKSSLQVEVRRSRYFRETAWIIAELGRERGWNEQQNELVRRRLGGHLRAFFSLARAAARRSIREQVWARWRLFHLPLFLIMAVATALHVIAVWDIDRPSAADVEPAESTPAPGPRKPQQVRQVVPPGKADTRAAVDARRPAAASGTIPARQPPAAQPPAPKQQVARPAPKAKPETQPAGAPPAILENAPQPPRPLPPEQVAKPQPAAPRPAPEAVLVSPEPIPRAIAEPLAPPKPAVLPQRAPEPPRQPIVTAEAPRIVVAPVEPPRPAQVQAQRPAPKAEPVAAPPPAPLAAEPRAAQLAPQRAEQPAPKPDHAPDAVSELQRRELEANPMGLGVRKPRSLAEQIALLKAQHFDHSRTRFPLTGKHVKVACESCHTRQLEGTPRECIACHKKDDIHRGRRPSCGSCHTTIDWRTRLPKR
jgi:hypothetical protein